MQGRSKNRLSRRLALKDPKFIIEKAATILEFVEAVVDSIYNIATGQIDGAANYIEKSLANLVPILIGFLADLLGLGGVSEKIKEFNRNRR